VLSLSILIVSCENPLMYDNVSSLMVRFQEIGGAYWIIQTEFFRHFIMNSLLAQRKSSTITEVKQLFSQARRHPKVFAETNDIASQILAIQSCSIEVIDLRLEWNEIGLMAAAARKLSDFIVNMKRIVP
jgi:hypothetical protein